MEKLTEKLAAVGRRGLPWAAEGLPAVGRRGYIKFVIVVLDLFANFGFFQTLKINVNPIDQLVI